MNSRPSRLLAQPIYPSSTFAKHQILLKRLTVREVRPGLERTTRLLDALGRPDRNFSVVQVTGTNGKGSVSALIASSLVAAGFRVGRFTSPHLAEERERIQINHAQVSAKAFSRAVEKLRPALEALQKSGNPATAFEAWTVMAAWLFYEARVDWAVMEVGMGGRLDATTALESARLSVLTHVALDHTRELGGTRRAILLEKLGIMRPGIPLVAAEPDPDLRALIRTQARKRCVPVAFSGLESGDAARLRHWERTENGLRLDLELGREKLPGLQVALEGAFQSKNAALACLALRKLGVGNSAIRRGFQKVVWPGRMERVWNHPEIYLDGAHNPDAIQALAAEFRARGKSVYLVAGMMRDKDSFRMVKILAPQALGVWTVRPPDKRGLEAERLARIFRQHRVSARACASYRGALRRALQSAGAWDTVVVAGSLYNIEPARQALRKLLLFRPPKRDHLSRRPRSRN